MSKVIDEKTVKHVATLSRLSLTDDALGKFTVQLSGILDYINKLNELDTKDCEPTSHALNDMKNVFRADIVKTSLPVDDALANAPKRINDFFGVPKVIE
jgi:aspartyl-tRNA(Asn)/glutamyl-tRNA(Gln) amidotransferase subunit C